MSGPLIPLDTSPALSHLKQLTMPQKKPLLPPLLYSLTKNCLLGTSHVVLHDQRTPPGQDQGTFHGQSYEKVFFFSSFLTFSFFFYFHLLLHIFSLLTFWPKIIALWGPVSSSHLSFTASNHPQALWLHILSYSLTSVLCSFTLTRSPY